MGGQKELLLPGVWGEEGRERERDLERKGERGCDRGWDKGNNVSEVP